MNGRRLVVACLVVLTIALAGQGSRPAGTSAAGHGAIEGSVMTAQPYPDGTPLEGWRVLLGTNECKLISSTTTDAHGVYRFPNLEPGNYAVELAFDQPHGQGWELLEPTQWASTCGHLSVVPVEAGKMVSGQTFRVDLIDDPRGFFGSVFDDLNENGQRDSREPGFDTSMREMDIDVIIEFHTDMEGNFRSIGTATPPAGVPAWPPLNLTTCPAYPTERDNRTGYRLTAPVPDSCGRNGCATRVDEQVFRCADYGLYLVDPNPAYFSGEIWVNAAPVAPGSVVTASIGSTVCGEGYVYGTGPISGYEVIVRSANVRGGCGTEGTAVHFTLNGQSVPTVGYWHVRTMQELQQSVDIIVGPPFAVFDVELALTGGPTRTVQAFVGGTLCAEGVASSAGMLPYPRVTLVVPPESLRPGCGREGATVRFVVDGVTYSPTAVWAPGEQRLQLMAGPVVKPPPTGSGGYLPH